MRPSVPGPAACPCRPPSKCLQMCSLSEGQWLLFALRCDWRSGFCGEGRRRGRRAHAYARGSGASGREGSSGARAQRYPCAAATPQPRQHPCRASSIAGATTAAGGVGQWDNVGVETREGLGGRCEKDPKVIAASESGAGTDGATAGRQRRSAVSNGSLSMGPSRHWPAGPLCA